MVATLYPSTDGPPAPRAPAWGERSIGAVAGGLLVMMGFGLAPARSDDPGAPSSRAGVFEGVRVAQPASPQRGREAWRRFEAFAIEAGLSPDEQRRTRGALADLQETWTAALGYYEAIEETDPRLPGAVGLIHAVHAAEIEGLIGGAAAARLAALLGPVRGALAEKRLAPLGAFVASTPDCKP